MLFSHRNRRRKSPLYVHYRLRRAISLIYRSYGNRGEANRPITQNKDKEFILGIMYPLSGNADGNRGDNEDGGDDKDGTV